VWVQVRRIGAGGGKTHQQTESPMPQQHALHVWQTAGRTTRTWTCIISQLHTHNILRHQPLEPVTHCQHRLCKCA
jgi:hypothetical protein